MDTSTEDKLNKMLKDGWKIEGYSTCIMTAGALVHNILLQKEERINTISIVTNGDKELGRNMHVFCPIPEQPKKKGFFS